MKRSFAPYRIPANLARSGSSTSSDDELRLTESLINTVSNQTKAQSHTMATPQTNIGINQPKELDSQKLNFLSSTILPFDGSEIELAQFLESTETFLIALDLPQPTAIQSRLLINVIKSKLKGQAKILVLGRPEINTWQDIRNLLIQNFSDHKSLQTWQNEICLLQRDVRESLQNFCNKILCMRSKIVQKIQLLYSDPNERSSLQLVYTSLLLNKLKSNLPPNFETIILSRPDLNDIESVVQAILELETYFEYKNTNKRLPETQTHRPMVPPVRHNLPPKPNYYYRPLYSQNPQPNFIPRQFPSSQPSMRQPQVPIRPSYSQSRPLLPPRKPFYQQTRPTNVPGPSRGVEPEPMDTSSTTLTKYQNTPRNFHNFYHDLESQTETYDPEESQYFDSEDPEYPEQLEEHFLQAESDLEPENFQKVVPRKNPG